MTLFGKKNYTVESLINGRHYSRKFRTEASALRYIHNALVVVNDTITDVIEKNETTTEYYSNDLTRFFVIKNC